MNQRNAHGGDSSHATFDRRRTQRRLRWAEIRPLAELAVVVIVAGAALVAREWSAALLFAVLVLPSRYSAWQTLREEQAALFEEVDFLDRERKLVERRLGIERFNAVFGLVLALLAVWAATFGTRGAPAFWFFAAYLIVRSLLIALVVAPALKREVLDLGGTAPWSWRTNLVFALFVISLPVLLPGRLIYRGIRRLIGRPIERDAVDDDEDAT